MNKEIKCVYCLADFKSEANLNEHGKCEMCEKLHPGVKNKDELKKNPEEKENEGRFKNIVTKQINEMLSEYGILSKCDCGEFFYKRSPAQKRCGKDTCTKETN